jgi:glycosyltransferase involved in cell wall biosynthesis
LPDELKEQDVLVVLIPPDYEFLEEGSPPRWMIVRREETLSHEMFDDYLFASDAVILHKFQSRYRAVVSSTVFQALGAGCPILVPGQSDFFFPFKEEVIRYADSEDLKETLTDLFKDGERYRMQKERAESFVRENSSEVIAGKFIEVFNSLKDA